MPGVLVMMIVRRASAEGWRARNGMLTRPAVLCRPVTRIFVTGRQSTAGFVIMPLRVSHPSALAILSIIITSTPGTACIDYSTVRKELMIHVFDLVDEQEWIELIANRYERLLLEMFE